ncbi:MAG: BspA family leucine-rich repeat surface protein [Promethearchaeota archaeon]
MKTNNRNKIVFSIFSVFLIAILLGGFNVYHYHFPEPIWYEGFVSYWDTTQPGESKDDQIKLPLEERGTYNFTVWWGDGTNDTITSWNQSEVTHMYSSIGAYRIIISGTIIGWRFNYGGDRLKLLEVFQWGDLRLGNSGGYFAGCSNLDYLNYRRLKLTGTTNLSRAFWDCWKIEMIYGIEDEDVSRVTDMSYMFAGADAFNQNISRWDVSSVTDMSGMFAGALSFNQNIGTWNVSSVQYINDMFLDVTLSNSTYDSILVGWASLAPNLQSEVTFHAGNSMHSTTPEVLGSKAVLEGYPYNWIIIDGMP